MCLEYRANFIQKLKTTTNYKAGGNQELPESTREVVHAAKNKHSKHPHPAGDSPGCRG